MNTLALVMIVKNESRCIERCLQSAKPWVHEMIVVDTGSTDDTVALAQQCGAAVHHFKWCDDFAAARNHALALSGCEWNLTLDADEWLLSHMECLHSLAQEAPDFIGQVRVSSEFDSVVGGASHRTHSPSWMPRLLPASVRYKGRIHEQPSDSFPRKRMPLLIAHDGYLPEFMIDKSGRNQALLEQALLESPRDAYLLYQLAKELEVRGQFAQAWPYFELAYALTEPQALWRHDVVLRSLFTLKKLHRFEVAFQMAQAEMPLWSHSPDFFFVLGDLLLDWALHDVSHAQTLLPMIEMAWLEAIRIGEQPLLQDTVQGRGSHLAAHNLHAYYTSLGQTEKANQWAALKQSLTPIRL